MTSGKQASLRVWDPLVRTLHWSLVLGFFSAWLTRHSPGSWHEALGYIVAGVVLIRVLWGWIGSRYARFSQFIRPLRTTIGYAAKIPSGAQPRYIGHNPLGGWMILVMIASVFATCVSGWLYTTDRFWGVEWVEEVHSAFTNLCLGLIVLHVSGVVLSSRHGHENLVMAMFHGRKRPPSGSDVD